MSGIYQDRLVGLMLHISDKLPLSALDRDGDEVACELIEKAAEAALARLIYEHRSRSEIEAVTRKDDQARQAANEAGRALQELVEELR